MVTCHPGIRSQQTLMVHLLEAAFRKSESLRPHFRLFVRQAHLRSMLRIKGLGCKAKVSRGRVVGLGFRVQGLEFRVEGVEFRV